MKTVYALFLTVLLITGCGRSSPSDPVVTANGGGETGTVVAPGPVVEAGPVRPAAAAPADPRRLTVATFNLKFYGDEDAGNDRDYGDFGENVRRGDAELTGEIAALLDGADIIGLQEIENQAALDNLISALNARQPARRYRGYMHDSRLPQDIALIWDAARVTARNAGQIDRRFQVVGYDGDRQYNFARMPLTAEFTKNGVTFSVLVVHLKAKSTSGTALSDARRAAECDRLLDWLDAQRAGGTGEHCMIIGDFNDRYDAGGVDTELDTLIDAQRAGRLRFLTAEFAAPAQYSNFGRFRRREYQETIDHIIIPAALFEHYLAGSCRALMHRDARLSDHHPVLADFRM